MGRPLTWSRVFGLLAALLYLGVSAAQAASLSSAGLMGTVKSSDGKPLEGVPVSAQAQGDQARVSVAEDVIVVLNPKHTCPTEPNPITSKIVTCEDIAQDSYKANGGGSTSMVAKITLLVAVGFVTSLLLGLNDALSFAISRI